MRKLFFMTFFAIYPLSALFCHTSMSHVKSTLSICFFAKFECLSRMPLQHKQIFSFIKTDFVQNSGCLPNQSRRRIPAILKPHRKSSMSSIFQFFSICQAFSLKNLSFELTRKISFLATEL